MGTKSEWLAHIAEDGRKQTVLDHLDNVAALCAEFASAFGAEEAGRLVGEAHDIGKYSKAFQKRLSGGARVDHATAGAYECQKLKNIPAAFCISGHHGGLPDKGGKADQDKPTLVARLRKAQEGRLEDYSAWRQEVILPESVLPQWIGRDLPAMDFFIRMLYSCLVDADYLDTEEFMTGEKVRRNIGGSIEELNRRLDTYIAEWFPPKGELNICRCQILQQCMKNGISEQPGLFTLTVPTGGGKTVSSMAFALRHARQYGLKRIIYVIPYTSIIEQTADTFRKIFGKQHILEHHSGVLFDTAAEGEIGRENLRLMRATENWDMPVIVTTAVQFFESIYANQSSKCRKIHNLAESVIVFDEAQMMPLPYLRPCISAISQLIAHYHVSAVLCTATQPALEPIFAKYLPDYSARELCAQTLYQNPIFQRTVFHQEAVVPWDEIAKRMNEQEQVLCIVNSKKNAQMVYEQLAGEGCYHLSTLMYPAHRRRILSEIHGRLRSDHPKPCRVVATSLIEAGVDVDFPQVYREMAGLDSILQAAGRCNRERKRELGDSIVTIFQPENRAPVLFSAAIGASKEVMNLFDDIACQEAITAYFREWRSLMGNAAQDRKDIMKLIQSGTFAFQTIADEFHLIENDTYTIYIPLEKGAELVEQLRMGEYTQELFRALGQYSVSVFSQHLEALERAGDIESVEGLRKTYILTNTMDYSEETGLTLEPEYGKAFFI